MTDLVGRKAECATLVRLAQTSRDEGAHLVLVRGSRGIGKSSLLAAARRELGSDDVTVLCATGRAPAAEYGSVRELFEALGPAAGALPETTAGQLDDYAVLCGLYRLAVNVMADRPLVIMLDDANACDARTLRWIDFLVRRSAELPLVVVLAWEPGVVEQADLLFADMAGIGPAVIIDLAPLSAPDVATVVERAYGRGPEPVFAETCGLITGGNPLWLHRLLALLRTRDVPPDESGVERARELGRQLVTECLPELIEEPGAHVHEVACAIAVLGPADARTVGRFLGLPEPFVTSAVDALRRKEVLADRELGFRHEDIAGAVLSAVPTAKLAELRHRAATLLNDEGRPADEVAGQLVWLPELPEDWMLSALRQAAAAAVRRGALELAERCLTRVLGQTPGHPATLLELANVLVMMEPATALPRLTEVVDQMADTGEKMRILCRLGLMSVAATWSEAAFDRLAMILDEGENSRIDSELLLQVHAVLLTVGLGEQAGTARLLTRYRVPPQRVPDTASGRLISGVAAQAEMLAGECVRSTVDLARQGLVPGPVVHAGPALAAATVLGLSGEPVEAMAALDRLIATSRADGALDVHALALAARAGLLDHAGDLADAHADARAALKSVGRAVTPVEVGPLRTTMASILLKQGDIAGAEEHLERVGEPLFGWTYGPVMVTKAAVRRARGDLTGALDLLLECGRRLMSAGVHNPVWAPWWLDAVCLLVRLDRREEAVELAEAGAERARRWDTLEARGLSLMASGTAATGPLAAELLSAAVTDLSGSAARPLHVRAVRLLGESRLSDGDAKGAREHLRTAVNLAIRLGDRTAAAEARELLVLAGGRMPKLGAGPADALSGRERRVAELAAAGASNREIAGELFVTVRTVESHLSNVYRKLGVELRADLPAALATSLCTSTV
ncbi:ATP-, maltotriose-and DNA-dependent transcriptional regulator MalT [Lentzea waywayandensis]|uniref:ATP-, maltotriose-and DNA-dependent transcriptional regulator MalT n=1 Tax=Lentzea waywayandensis TaxID=84724 RepID=A0A1I6DF53_9PSEU|nr:LuxR family transcriptional regulator [Lentzea waywayandensis]SFR04037.1 ATP-, maltotriose-and DNA-dependent transcriptional regulator MalT [Lentzea waywayandensis]